MTALFVLAASAACFRIEAANYNIQGVDATAREIFEVACEVLKARSTSPLEVDDQTGREPTVDVGTLGASAAWSGVAVQARSWDCPDGGANIEVIVTECGPDQDPAAIARSLVDEIVAAWREGRPESR